MMNGTKAWSPILALMLALMVLASCGWAKDEEHEERSMEMMANNSFSPPAWARNAVIYEVNLRQYTQEGTIRAFMEHLPRLRGLGVDILWLMPVQPVGDKNRKGSLGSPYSVRDYRAVDTAYGDLGDFKALVTEAHSLGMYVLLDWVANHSAWDNALVFEHPEWYTHDASGNITMPEGTDWADVADLDYGQPGLREYMAESMLFWLRETGIDGFRCDMAGMVPVDFWNWVRPRLDSVKQVFMLAEWDDPVYHEQAFDMSYTWPVHHVMNDVARGEKTARELEAELRNDASRYAIDQWRMFFTSNHDENSWQGSAIERFGDGLAAFTVLTYVLPGMPLIYSGQEAGLDRRLAFFEKDRIEWRAHPMAELYALLGELRHSNPALWTGSGGGSYDLGCLSDHVLWVVREKAGHQVVAVLNLCGETSMTELIDERLQGTYTGVFGDTVSLDGILDARLAPWGYKLIYKQEE